MDNARVRCIELRWTSRRSSWCETLHRQAREALDLEGDVAMVGSEEEAEEEEEEQEEGTRWL
jgi:hypothetical protein